MVWRKRPACGLGSAARRHACGVICAKRDTIVDAMLGLSAPSDRPPAVWKKINEKIN